MLKAHQAASGVLRAKTSAVLATVSAPLQRQLHETQTVSAKALPPRTKIHDDDIEEAFLKGSGPGGQKINKTASAVQLIHKPTGMVVKVQDTRSREQNRKIARNRLGEMVQFREKGDESRMALKVKAAAKKKASATKKSRRKYRALDEAKKTAETSGSNASSEQSGAAAATAS